MEESHTSCAHLGSSKRETVLVIEPVMDAQRQGETGSQINGLLHAINITNLCLNMTAVILIIKQVFILVYVDKLPELTHAWYI